jgi:hypothetical protein
MIWPKSVPLPAGSVTSALFRSARNRLSPKAGRGSSGRVVFV